MSIKQKPWTELDIHELTEVYSQYLHNALLVDGGKGMKAAVFMLLQNLSLNKDGFAFMKEYSGNKKGSKR
jgi:hypothetical protein